MTPSQQNQYELALFAGGGGGILGGSLLGWRTVCAVEIDAYCRSSLLARQRDGILPWFPIWDDIRTFSPDNPECAAIFALLRHIRDQLVISGGFPCQDISSAGIGAGIDGERSGLWREFCRVIGEIRPARVLVENSPVLRTRGLSRVLGNLACLGYDAQWGSISALDAIFQTRNPAFAHIRERLFLLAYPHSNGFGGILREARQGTHGPEQRTNTDRESA